MKRVVITGLGVVSPLGCQLEEFWHHLTSGTTSVRPLTKLDRVDYGGNPLAAEVQGLADVTLAEEGANLASYGKAVHYAVAAARLSLEDAGLPTHLPAPNTHAVIIGTTSGNQDMVERTINHFDLQTTEDELSDEAAQMLAHFRPLELSATVASYFNLGGANLVIPTACAAGNYAIGTAYSLIQQGRTQLALAGGADPFTRSCYTIFYRLGAMTQQDLRPFDQDRTGMVVGEGAAMLVVEELEHALARGARIYAEVTSYGLSCDAYHSTAPDPTGSGAILAMEVALRTGNLRPEDISYISAHGTGTKANDAHEANAMAAVFGEKLRDIPVSGLKSLLGHCMGAASAFEAVASALSIRDQRVPGTHNTEQLDGTFPIPFPLRAPTDSIPVRHVLSNAFAFGGNICSVVFSQYTPQ